MLVLNVEQSAVLVEQAIKELGSVVAETDVEKIKNAVYQAWKGLGQARVLLRRPEIDRSDFPLTLSGCVSVAGALGCSLGPLNQLFLGEDEKFPPDPDEIVKIISQDEEAHNAAS